MFNFQSNPFGPYTDGRLDNLVSGVINVRAFEHPTRGWLGAVPDAVLTARGGNSHTVAGTDNYDVFSYARDLSKTTGKPIYVPPGDYRINTPLALRYLTPIIGSGPGSSLVSGNNNQILNSDEDLYFSGGYQMPASLLLSNLALDMRACDADDVAAVHFGYSLGYQILEYLFFRGSNWQRHLGITFGSGGIGYRHRNIFQALKFDYFRAPDGKATIYAPGDYAAGLQFNNNLFLNCNMYGSNVNYRFCGDANIWMQCGLGIGAAGDAIQIDGSGGKYAPIIIDRGYANQIIASYCEGVSTDVLSICYVNGHTNTNHPLNISCVSPGVNDQNSIVLLDNSGDESAFPTWAALTDYAVGTTLLPTTPNGFYYEVTTDGGSSGAAEPAWGTTVGGTTVDAGITWTCRAATAWRATYVSATSMTLKNDQSTRIWEDDILWVYMGADGWRFVTVTSRLFGGGLTTVNVSESRLTANLTVAYSYGGGTKSLFHSNSHFIGPKAPSVYKRRVRYAGAFVVRPDLYDYYDIDLRGVSLTFAAPAPISGHTVPKGQIITFDISLGSASGTVAWNAVYKTTWTNYGNISGVQSIISFQYDGANWNQIAYKPFDQTAGEGIRRDVVSITNAQIKALRAAPITLVAAPGAGYYLELVSLTLVHDYATAAFTESSDDLVVEYATSGVDATAAIDATGFLTAVADTMIQVLPVPLVATVMSNIVNNALRIKNTGDGEYATGGGTMQAIVCYRIHDDGV